VTQRFGYAIFEKWFQINLVLLLALGVCPIFQPGLAGSGNVVESQSPQYLPDRIIVKFATGAVSGPQRAAIQAFAMPAPVAEILALQGATENEQLFPVRPQLLQKNSRRADLSTIYEIRFAQAIDVQKLLSILRQQAGIVYAEPVYLRRLYYDPNDPSRGNQAYLNNIKAREAWDVTRGDTSVVIAIVDTGVDWQHPDLAANIWRNYKEIPNNGIDDDGNGYKDDIRGWDFGGANRLEDNSPREETPTHGTLVAGLASAVSDNGIGVAGVGFKCKIMPVKATNLEAPNSILYGFKGIAYAAENGADIINCSWGSSGYSQVEQEVIDYATSLGALVVAAAGNEGNNCPGYPAAYRHVLAVAATTSNDRLATFSSFGYWVDLAAPGTSIYGTWQPSTYTSFQQGTSFSSPLVAGVAALVKAQHPNWSPGAVAEKVRLACDNISSQNPGFDRQLGYGRANAQRAVLASNMPGVRIDSLWFREVAGDNDGYFEINEEITVSVRLRNFLEPANNLAVTLSENSAYVSVLSGGPQLVNIGRSSNATLANVFRFRVAGNAPTGQVAVLYLNFSAAGYDDWQGFAVSVGRFAGDLAAGNVATTISSFGAIGFSDYASCSSAQPGRGFEFPLGAKSALYHGGLLLATSANRVSDVSYGNANGDRYDFVTSAGGDLNIQPGSKATLELTSRFNDSVAEAPIGLTVDQKTLAWANAPWNDFVIFQYNITNTTTQAINNVYAGVYLDWDIGDDSNANFANWDNANQLGYEWANGSAYYGVTAVAPAKATSYRAVKNPDYVWTGFTDASKYQFMTEGFQVVSSNAASDWSQMLSSGPYNLAAGKTVTVAFAILGGTNLADLQANARAARDAYNSLAVSVDSPDNTPAPVRFELAQNAPNPFAIRTAANTEIRYSLAETGPVTLRIFNLLGQEIAVLLQGTQNRGSYAVQWDGRDRRGLAAPSGVYFYQLKTPNFTATRKLIVVE
jgi:subtilisin family serine protease